MFTGTVIISHVHSSWKTHNTPPGCLTFILLCLSSLLSLAAPIFSLWKQEKGVFGKPEPEESSRSPLTDRRLCTCVYACQDNCFQGAPECLVSLALQRSAVFALSIVPLRQHLKPWVKHAVRNTPLHVGNAQNAATQTHVQSGFHSFHLIYSSTVSFSVWGNGRGSSSGPAGASAPLGCSGMWVHLLQAG